MLKLKSEGNILRNKNQENEKEKRIRSFDRILGLLQFFFIGFAVMLAFYLFVIQIIDVGKYRAKARNQRINRSFVMRGDIYDRNGIKLATDKIYSDVYAHPENYDSKPEELAEKLFVTEKAVSRWETGRGTPDISLLIPFYYKYGSQKGRIMLFVVIMASALLIGGLFKILQGINFDILAVINKLENINFIILIFGILLFVLIIIYISYLISCKIYSKKEF